LTVVQPTAPRPLSVAHSGLSRLSEIQVAVLAITASLVVTIVSLAISHAIAFDPASWVVWGREVFGPGHISTTTYGSSWKPFGVVVIAPFSLITRGQADVYFWLFVNRFGILLGLFGAGALAYRYAGRIAAALTIVMIVISPWWVTNSMLGKAEPLAAALAVLGVLAYSKGWVRLAWVLAVCVTLIRPEAWPFAFIFGVWLLRTHRLSVWYVVPAGVAVLALWAVPELFHTGPGAAGVATSTPALGDAARYGRIPAYLVLKDSVAQMHAIPAVLAALGVIGASYGLLRKWRPSLPSRPLAARSTEELIVTLFGPAWLVVVAVMAEIGFAGSPRYLIPGETALIITAAIVAVRLIGNSRILLGVAAAITIATIVHTGVNTLQGQAALVRRQDGILTSIQRNIKRHDCVGATWTSASWTALVAELTDQSIPQSMRLGAGPRGLHSGRGPGWAVSCAPVHRGS
jgi:hypothetical protein